MLRPEYLSRKLTSPLPTKDGGTLRTIREACEYMAAIGKERERRLHWQRVREVMLQEADEAAVTWRVQLAVLSVAGRKNSSRPKSKGTRAGAELQQAEARLLAEEERRREEAENRPFWRRFWPYSRP